MHLATQFDFPLICAYLIAKGVVWREGEGREEEGRKEGREREKKKRRRGEEEGGE